MGVKLFLLREKRHRAKACKKVYQKNRASGDKIRAKNRNIRAKNPPGMGGSSKLL